MVVSKLEVIPLNIDIGGNGIKFTRILTKFQSDDIIFELTAYDQSKSLRARATSDVRAEQRTVINFVLSP